jgi:hypothetical protein
VGNFAQTHSRTLVVQNISADVVEYELGWEQYGRGNPSDRGVTVAVEPESLALAPGVGGTVTVSLAIDPRALPDWDLRGFNLALDERVIGDLETQGAVVAAPVGTGDASSEGPLRVPFYVLPRRHSCLSSEPSRALFYSRIGQNRPVVWSNPCFQDGEVEAFNLVGTDPAESAGEPAFPEVVDIEAVGVRIGPGQTRPDTQLVEWAIKTRGHRRLPVETEFHIYVDLDLDGAFDRVVFNRLGRYVINFPEVANRWVVAHAPLKSGSLEPDIDEVSTDLFSQLYDLDESVSLLQVAATDLGIDVASDDPTFGFAVRAFDAAGDYAVTESFPGHDSAPDGLADGRHFIFSSERAACLSFRGADAETLLQPQQGLIVAGETKREMSVRLVCDPRPTEDGAAGFIVSFPGNEPGARQSAILEYKPLGDGVPVFLPYSGQG